MVKVAVCGGSGYVGSELLRILGGHPNAEVVAVTAEKNAGERMGALFPHLRKYAKLVCEPIEKEKLLNRAEVFFLALPHKASQEPAEFFFNKGKKVIDLSADFRLRDPKTYEQWYATPHGKKAALKKAVYGLPELYRSKIAKAGLVANPGCYPTGAILALMPIMKKGVADPLSIVIDSASGVSGAGRQSNVAYGFSEIRSGFKAYGLVTHRHTPEIEQELSALYKSGIKVNFTPHLLPVERGILTTAYAKLLKFKTPSALHAAYEKAYEKEPFVRVLPLGEFPDIKNVRGTNFVDIGVAFNPRTGTAIIVSAIDNLVKGAAGQAVQNFNIMMGFYEAEGLRAEAVFP